MATSTPPSQPPTPSSPNPPPDGASQPAPEPFLIHPLADSNGATTPPIPNNDDSEDDDASTNDAAVSASHASKKQKTVSSLISEPAKSLKSKSKKKKNNNVWTKSTSRKGKKKPKQQQQQQQQQNHLNGQGGPAPAPQDTVLITPISRFPDRTDDSPDATICLSRTYKAERVELSDDRLTAGSTKGYRMVRATRGVTEGSWYFEIKVIRLGETGHTRLGWTTEKGDLQAPVGYDGNSFGYRDIDGSKVHKALTEKYGEEGYTEGDVIGFYINLPDGHKYAPKPLHLVWYKGQRYTYSADGKDDPPEVVPGSVISFFKNGTYQGPAYMDLFGGRYYPAASMYTLPNQPNCEVRFNFGPNFDCFPKDFGSLPIPRPMIEVPYHGYDSRGEVATSNGVPEKTNVSANGPLGEASGTADVQAGEASGTALHHPEETAHWEPLEPTIAANVLGKEPTASGSGLPVEMAVGRNSLLDGNNISVNVISNEATSNGISERNC